MTTAISHLTIQTPDWFALRLLPDRACADAITEILKGLDRAERTVYAIRGEVLRLFDERELYREFTDPATKQSCTCTYRWLQIYMPDSHRYLEEALKNRQRLAEAIPLEQAAKIPRANLRLLEQASESVQRNPEVHTAAETMPEKQFAQKLSVEYHQHLEAKVTLKFKYEPEDAAQVRRYLDWIIGKAELEPGDYQGALLYLAIHELQEMTA